MKKIFLLFTLFICLGANFFAADKYVSDVSLYNEINLAFKNEYYPGTVDKVSLLEQQFPDSVFLSTALAYKGDALINMYRYGEAISTLENAVSRMYTGSQEMAHCTYLLGKAYYYEKNYTKALEQFHLACNLSLTDKSMDYYHPSILYAARSFFVMEKYAARKENCAFDQMMRSLPKGELQALCNACFNNGKWSLYSSSVVLTSLKQKQLILASETEGIFGSIEFALTDRARDYLTKHPDFFSNQNIFPEQEDTEQHFPYAII